MAIPRGLLVAAPVVVSMISVLAASRILVMVAVVGVVLTLTTS